MPKHALVFVHGMGGAEPADDYAELFSAIAEAWADLHRRDRAEFDARFELVPVSWGGVTADAKAALHRLAFDRDFVEPGLGAVVRPIAGLRTFMTKFLGDVVAYVSEDDNLIRRDFLGQLQAGVREASGYSIVAHSLGAAIAHDFLFDLMIRDRLFEPLEPVPPEVLAPLQQRFHGFFSMGSPVGLFMLRRSVAFAKPVPFAGLRVPLRVGQRWLNFWDAQDVIAYPVAGLFANDRELAGTVQDVRVDTGDLVVDSHIRYWRNREVARSIAAALP